MTLTCFGLHPKAEAGVIWLAANTPDGLTLTTTGTLNIGDQSGFPTQILPNNGVLLRSFGGQIHGSPINTLLVLSPSGGTAENVVEFGLPRLDLTTTDVVGDSFGHSGLSLIWDVGLGLTPGTITPVTTMTFSGETVSSTFGSTLDSGDITVWESNDTGDTISVGLVPEPTSTVLCGLSSLGLILLRRRK